MIVLDTNVLVYASGGEHPLRDPARALFEAIVTGRVPATATAEVIQEFAHVVGRRRPRGEAAAAARRYARILTPLAASTSHDLESGLRLFSRYERLGAFDAVLAAVALRENATALVSADGAFADVSKLPFVELGSPELDRILG